MREWSDWERSDWKKIQDEYLSEKDQSETLLTQAVTCVCKLVYRYFNNNDFYAVFRSYLDLTTYANWLYEHIEETNEILDSIFEINSMEEYPDILWKLSEIVFSESFVSKYKNIKAKDNIYECYGHFVHIEPYQEEDW